ncbi:MAG: ADP-ribosylation factor-like protein [Anaerolineae bacterium]
MNRAYKIIITGAFNSGKSEFIRTVSDIPVVSTERPITSELDRVKEETTVAMDYGQVTVEGRLFHLFGTPGQTRFSFMRDILSQEMDGMLVLVDSSDPSSLNVTRRLLRRLRRRNQVPFLITATKQDSREAMSLEKIAAALRLEPPGLVVPCDARQRSSVEAVLKQLLDSLG